MHAPPHYLSKASEDEPDPSEDALLVETGNILLDYIGLTRQVALVENMPSDVNTTIQ